MEQGGYGLATVFGGASMAVGNASFPLESAMSVRCAKDEPRYTGATPPPNSWNMISSATNRMMDVEQNTGIATDIKIYPNPTSGLFTISSSNIPEGKVQIINMNGTIIYSNVFKNLNEWQINIQNQPAGIYILKIQNEQKIITQKIIKN